MTNFISLAIFAYLFGSISWGHLIAKIKKVDLTKIGSGSPTGTNVARALGWRWGMISGILDLLKGVIPTYLALNYLINDWQIVTIAFLPTLGHIFPVFFKFKGGRGASTFFGASLVLFGPKFFFPLFLIWILIFFITRTAGLTNFIFPWIFSTFLYFYWPGHPLGPYFIFGISEAILINFALRNNIKRLIRGEEPKTPLKF